MNVYVSLSSKTKQNEAKKIAAVGNVLIEIGTMERIEVVEVELHYFTRASGCRLCALTILIQLYIQGSATSY